LFLFFSSKSLPRPRSWIEKRDKEEWRLDEMEWEEEKKEMKGEVEERT